ncbi:hypothetical protein FNV43_RR12471 [Rhamnella rubrinervis]|uniref:Uncharacterized protein n=1 Tax=Rhamnella rubrinervis TaxID=2594499 RepID=A0A8K0MIB0_9ROSA|nr:hypothetical protein FNV43_RR12471 [Rhamnella rubrinervis]
MRAYNLGARVALSTAAGATGGAECVASTLPVARAREQRPAWPSERSGTRWAYAASAQQNLTTVRPATEARPAPAKRGRYASAQPVAAYELYAATSRRSVFTLAPRKALKRSAGINECSCLGRQRARSASGSVPSRPAARKRVAANFRRLYPRRY